MSGKPGDVFYAIPKAPKNTIEKWAKRSKRHRVERKQREKRNQRRYLDHQKEQR